MKMKNKEVLTGSFISSKDKFKNDISLNDSVLKLLIKMIKRKQKMKK